jgi:hypothetical protein
LSLAFAVAASLPLVMQEPDGTVSLSPVIAAVVGGYLIAFIVRILRGEDETEALMTSLRHSIGASVYAAVFVVARVLFESTGEDLAALFGFAVGASTWFLLETFIWSFLAFGVRRFSHRYLWLLAVKDWMVVTSLLATGALFGFAIAELDVWAALAVAAVPYGFAHFAFRRNQDARTTYWQTIRALARIPEVAGLSPNGHGDRVSTLAEEVAQRLSMTPDEVEDIRFAAMMHDIGRITLNEPTIIRMGFTEEDIARWGAEIIGEAPYLERIAEFVRQQHHPYRRPGEYKDAELPMASKIIKAASAYDHATRELGFSTLEALEVLHRGAAYDYDPDVVEALREIIESRPAIA